MRGTTTRTKVLLAALCALPVPAVAATLTVDVAGGADFLSIGEAVSAALAGDSVLVMAGIYSGASNLDLNCGGRDLVLRAPAGAASTVIDCQGLGRAFRLYSGESSACRIEGFTLRDGDTDWGGLVRLGGASPCFTDCVFEGGHAVSGGALHCSGGGAAEFLRCTFRGNAADASGGALHVTDASPRFTDCRFEENVAPDGGAVYCGVVGEAEFTGCRFLGNAAAAGGALYAVYAEPSVTACRFFDNAAERGGAAYLLNCWPSLVESSFARNSSGVWCRGAAPQLERCLLAFGGTAVTCEAGAAPVLTHCCLFANLGEGGCDLAGENLALDPLLCDLNGGGLELCANSPCLPAGNAWGEQIGAMGAACGDCDQTAAQRASWSQIKSYYR